MTAAVEIPESFRMTIAGREWVVELIPVSLRDAERRWFGVLVNSEVFGTLAGFEVDVDRWGWMCSTVDGGHHGRCDVWWTALGRAIHEVLGADAAG